MKDNLLLRYSFAINKQVSPVHWTTMSDTIAVSPGAVPILKGFCGSLDALGHHNDHSAVARCKSASNLEDSMKNLSDEEVLLNRFPS